MHPSIWRSGLAYSGDANLRMWMGRKVCEPGLAGTAETCHLTGPGGFYVSVTGIDPSSSFTLNIQYTRAHRDGGSADGGAYDGVRRRVSMQPERHHVLRAQLVRLREVLPVSTDIGDWSLECGGRSP